jgi:uncharacterized membrane protein
MLTEKKHKYIWLIILIFGLLYANISLLNHFLFRTTAWDMGIFNNALYDYAHLEWNDSMVRIPMSPNAKNLLADHLELYLLLFSPFYYLFGSYTLLIFQIVSILWGGYGVYKFVLHKTNNEYFSRIALIHFFCTWGIYTALAFDYHNNVVAAMGVPWFLYYFDKKKFNRASLLFIFIIIGKENMPLWMGFIGLALAIWHFKDRQKAVAGALYALSGFAFFILAIKVIIPAFAPPGEGYAYNTYTALGNNFGEVAKTALTRPWYVFTLLFKSHLPDPNGDSIKMMTHIVVLLSGGWALFYRPKYLFMLIPIYGQKLFYDETTRWGVYCHYSIEFVPLISIALFITLYELLQNKEKWLYRISIFSVVLTFATTFHILEKMHIYRHQSATHRFFAALHYKREFDVKEAYKALKTIPDNASVSAQSILVPHLSFRDSIYMFPAGKWADYIVLITAESTFKIEMKDFDSLRTVYTHDKTREIMYDKNSMLIIKKKD